MEFNKFSHFALPLALLILLLNVHFGLGDQRRKVYRKFTATTTTTTRRPLIPRTAVRERPRIATTTTTRRPGRPRTVLRERKFTATTTTRRPKPNLKELKREVRQTLNMIEMAPEFSEEQFNMKYPMDKVKDMLTSTNPFMQNLVDQALSKMDPGITNPMERVQDFLGYMDEGFFKNMNPQTAAKMAQSTDKLSDFITRNFEALQELITALVNAGKKILSSFTKLFGDIFSGFAKTLSSFGAPN